ncbi:ABC transporter permease, partial [[Kitasatospora] papulosa]
MTHIQISPGAVAPGDGRSVPERSGAGDGPPPNGGKGTGRGENLAGYLFMSPWIAGFLFLIAGPMVFSLY